MKESRTHFEQVPVEVVKQIAIPDDAAAMPATPRVTAKRYREKKGRAARVAARAPARKRK
jgi:hypothetical protein